MQRKTHEEFCNEIYEQVGNEYTVKSKYKTVNKHVLMKHELCGYEWEVLPTNFLKNKSRCPLCFGNIKIDNDVFINKLDIKYSGNAVLLSNFNGLHNDVTIKFVDCGHIHTTKAKNFIYKSNNGCNICNKNEKKTNDEFRKEVYNLVQDEYKVLSDYSNTHSHVLMEHTYCGNKYKVAPSDFLSGKRCPKCQHRSYKKTIDEFKQEVYDLVGDEYDVLGEYINGHEKILIKHNKCGSIYPVAPTKFLNGRRCPSCMRDIIAEKQRKTHEQFKSEVYELVGDEYTIISEYINSQTHIDMKHNKCGNIYSVKSANFINGRRCPFCNESKGEHKVRKYLDDINIVNIPQYKFNDLLSDKGYNLKFDFGVLNKFNNLLLLIEYDGQQHFEWIPGMMTYEQFERLQLHDQMKNKYCKNNNITLLRIPYWDFNNIENILDNYLTNL